ncbi:MAG: hypothetical protein IPJ65_23520 [Archangiaceae bacterium]|nr:hypothetical protein [Archangiaceae bacterium]
MNRSLFFAVVVWCAGCGTSDLVSSEGEGAVATQDELNVGACFHGAGDPRAFLDGGVQRLQACLADAGFGIPPLPRFDGGIPALPHLDGGIPPLPQFDGGFTVPAFDAGVTLPPLPSVDAGVPAGLLSTCSAGCTCPSGLRCLNPLSQTCPGTLTLCIP